jgi:Ca2+-binding RTX toxin-like protein
MNRLYILLTVMVVMVGALFAGQEALAEVLTGTSGNDTLLGTDEEDYIKGRGGDDYLNGGGGDDTIEGGSGNDEIIPGEGDDVVLAGPGNDLIYARHRGDGLHRLRGRLRQGRDHSPRRPDQEQLRESPRPSPG